MEAAEKIVCPICHKERPPHFEGMKVCSVCMGSESEVIKLPKLEEQAKEYTCECGKKHAGTRLGKQISARCRECINRNIKAGRHGHKEQPMEPIEVDEKNKVTINFSDYPELLEKLERIARREFRTPAGQILWLINSELETGPVEEMKCSTP